MRRRIILSLAIVFGAAVSSLSAPQAASAIDCSHEQYGMRRMTGDTGPGTQADIYVRNRTLNDQCTGPSSSEAHSTAHSTSPPRFAEVGWVERGDNFFEHKWDVWWEYHDSSMTYGNFGDGDSIGCCSWYRFRVRYTTGDGGWKFFYDPGANGNFIQIGALVHPGFTDGISIGETGRRPGSVTGLKDHMRNMMYKPSGSASFTSWLGNSTYAPLPSGWHYVNIAADEFWACADSDSSCP
jgi:hypothetical protein